MTFIHAVFVFMPKNVCGLDSVLDPAVGASSALPDLLLVGSSGVVPRKIAASCPAYFFDPRRRWWERHEWPPPPKKPTPSYLASIFGPLDLSPPVKSPISGYACAHCVD